MRWPLRNQIMTPMLLVMLLAVLGLSAFHAVLAAQRKGREIEIRIQNVARTLAGSRFPLTDTVLEQMRGLAGAEFALVQADGRMAASTQPAWRASDLPNVPVAADADALRLGGAAVVAGETYIAAALRMPPRDAEGAPRSLYVLYPREAYQQQLWSAAWPAVAIGLPALLIVAVLAALVAARVGRPLARLRTQVERIVEGDFRPMPVPARHDEVRELVVAVNQMADKLSRYEERIRQTEQLRALAQLRGGLAHQLRNSATGARIALDLHRGDCSLGDDESLQVAARQLTLIEKYLRKFLTPEQAVAKPRELLDFARLVEEIIPLAGPAAKHAGLRLDVQLPDQPLMMAGDPRALEHLVLNLLLNAIEAAASAAADRDVSGDAKSDPRGEVRVAVASGGEQCVRLVVEDTGVGPPAELAERLFEPFVTGKPDGVGLGLSVARQAALEHRGDIRWERDDGRTRFIVELARTQVSSPPTATVPLS